MKKNLSLTEFEWKVLKTALTIPLGETRSYQWVANAIGSPKAVRAVGQALRKNPYPLMIPCHRVIRSDGSPGGYAGKMDGKKMRLLEREQEILKQLRRRSSLK
jgi:methylated-DNA-[protein]-cysteine S-methyltransferase